MPHVRDADAAIRFLTDVLGFGQAARYDDGGLVVHAELRWPEGGGVMLGSDRPGGPSLPPGVGVVYVVTQDPDGVHARATATGAKVSDLVERDYGSRECTATDPEGVVWSFGTYGRE
ncbi:MAG: VOC family protein [Actinomycetota bacterium]|nr:VOC family protein [Actinomycetota bacterium]